MKFYLAAPTKQCGLMSYCVTDANRPLMGQFQLNQGVISLPANCPSQAIVDISENMRAKIYAIFCKIGELLCAHISIFKKVGI